VAKFKDPSKSCINHDDYDKGLIGQDRNQQSLKARIIFAIKPFWKETFNSLEDPSFYKFLDLKEQSFFTLVKMIYVATLFFFENVTDWLFFF
jgi:hypothetical protein